MAFYVLSSIQGNMAQLQSENPVVVRTRCDHITAELRRVLLPHIPLAFVDSEEALRQRAAQGARLIVLHLDGDAADGGLAGRLLRAVPNLAAPLVALSGTEAGGSDGARQSELLDDVLLVRTERWQALLLAWAGQSARARQRVAELRLLHSCAPARLLPLFDRLTLAPESSLSVKLWSAGIGVSRARLYRDVAQMGMTPAGVVDVVRTLHFVGASLVVAAAPRKAARESFAVRTESRVLARTLGMTKAELTAAGAPGSPEVRALVAERLRMYFEHQPNRPSYVLPASSNFRT